MSTIANNSAALPEALMSKVRAVAKSEERSVDNLVTEAVEGYLQRKRLQDLYAYGERQGLKAAIQEDEVSDVVQRWRSANANSLGS